MLYFYAVTGLTLFFILIILYEVSRLALSSIYHSHLLYC